MPKTQRTSFGREPHTLGTAGLTIGAEHVKSAVNQRATLWSVPSAPHSSVPPDEQDRGTDPYLAIQDPELRLAVMRAHRNWAARYCPWLLERWLDE